MRSAKSLERFISVVCFGTTAAFVLYGALLALFPIFPFWIDEWLLIDNLKFKSPAALWHKLDHTQQFPRLYLEVIKAIASACNYSYQSMRLPSFLVHGSSIWLLYRLSGRLFREEIMERFLWIMLFLAYSTSIHYFVQLKQYTMEMALSLVAIWQLLELNKPEHTRITRRNHVLIGLAFALGPFFSYTYPIVIVPIYLIAAVKWVKTGALPRRSIGALFVGLVAVALSYWLDVRQVLADPGMQDFWKDLIMRSFSVRQLLSGVYQFFASMGTGDLFSNVLAGTGIAACCHALIRLVKNGIDWNNSKDVLSLYSLLLVFTVLALFVAGKLPLGTFRLNSFAVPGIGLLIVYFFQYIRSFNRFQKIVVAAMTVLLLESAGTIWVAMAEMGGKEQAQKVKIYKATEGAIHLARSNGLPIVVSSAIAFPFDDRWTGDWILKTHPAFLKERPVPVYGLPIGVHLDQPANQLPSGLKTAVLLDGDRYVIISR